MAFLEEASKVIRESGGRFTPQRQLIIELLDKEQAHLDADRLFQLAYQQDKTVSLATVYRTLNVLKEAGLIDQRHLSPDHERAAYEPASSVEHYHLTCRKCGRVIEFQTDLVEALKTELETALKVQVEQTCICLQGLCPDCQGSIRQ